METTYNTPLQVLRRTIADIKQDIKFHKYTLSNPEFIEGQFVELRKEVKKLQKLLKQYEFAYMVVQVAAYKPKGL